MRINNILKRGVGGVGIFGVGAPYPPRECAQGLSSFFCNNLFKKTIKKRLRGNE